MNRLKGASSHHDREIAELAADREGNPTLKTFLAVLKTVGMRLSVEPAPFSEVLSAMPNVGNDADFDARKG